MLFGGGGAGFYPDSKLIFSPSYGKTNILEFVPQEEGEEIVEKNGKAKRGKLSMEYAFN